MLKLFEAFSGVGAFHKGFVLENFEFELVGFSEIDPSAIDNYCLLHNVSPSLNYGDISKIKLEDLPKFDIFTFSFPCTDISIAGQGKGFIDEFGEITRSGLYHEGMRVLQGTKPKVCIIENVQNLTSKKFREEFYIILKDLEDLGYTNYYENLNLKDYGLPQNRERVFIVSILGEHEPFQFEMGFPLNKTLDDILEDEVSEDYFIAQDRVDELIHRIRLGKTGIYPDILETSLISSALGSREHRASGWKSICGTLCARDYKDPKVVAIPIKASKDTIHNVGGLNNKNSQSAQVFSPTGVSPTLTVTQPPKILQRFDLVKVGDLICKHDQRARVYSSNGIAPTVMTVHPPKILQKYDTNSDNVLYRIRRLTPLECWILLGFTLEDYNKVRYHSPSTSLEILKKYPKRKKYITSDNITLVERTSKSNLYKQAGNSIGVPVTRMLARQLRDSLRNYIQC